LFERVNERIKQQIEKVEEMTGDMDPKTNFALIVIQTELERYKYIVRSYLRARIAKVAMDTQAAPGCPEGEDVADLSSDPRSTSIRSTTCRRLL